MYAITSLLDDTHAQYIMQIWALLEEKSGIIGQHRAPLPHVSYHVAVSYHLEALDAVLQDICQHTQPFILRTNGLGIFSGEKPVLYLPILEGDDLIRLHRRIWQEDVLKHATEPRSYYQPEDWRPHITLAEGDLHHDNLPDVIRLLSHRDFMWHVPINNLAIIGGGNEDDKSHGLIKHYTLGA
jgi:hypothetical protein